MGTMAQVQQRVGHALQTRDGQQQGEGEGHGSPPVPDSREERERADYEGRRGWPMVRRRERRVRGGGR